MLPARTGRFLLQSPGHQGLCTGADAGRTGCRCFYSAGCRQSISRGVKGATSSSVGWSGPGYGASPRAPFRPWPGFNGMDRPPPDGIPWSESPEL